jgi:hypothetical protein
VYSALTLLTSLLILLLLLRYAAAGLRRRANDLEKRQQVAAQAEAFEHTLQIEADTMVKRGLLKYLIVPKVKLEASCKAIYL